ESDPGARRGARSSPKGDLAGRRGPESVGGLVAFGGAVTRNGRSLPFALLLAPAPVPPPHDVRDRTDRDLGIEGEEPEQQYGGDDGISLAPHQAESTDVTELRQP